MYIPMVLADAMTAVERIAARVKRMLTLVSVVL